MKIVVLSNYGDSIADLNALTAPNKQAYCDKHGYTFENINHPYAEHVKWLEIIRDRVSKYDVVMTVGCDVLFMNQTLKIERFIESDDYRPIIAREHISWWPINNDVMIWRSGRLVDSILREIIYGSDEWLSWPWLWQAWLWDWIQRHQPTKYIRIVEAREMNSCWQSGSIAKWQLGDWILHALNAADNQSRINIIKAYLPMAGDATYAGLPKEITRRK